MRRSFSTCGLLVALGAMGCGGGKSASNAPSGPTAGARDAGAAAADGGPAGPAVDERPFAGSTAEATTMISNVVDSRRAKIGTCVRDFRARKKIGQERVAVSFGIDQEGRLLGVTSKGKEDRELKDCVQEAVRDAPFPRSHAGVITITKSYEELVLP